MSPSNELKLSIAISTRLPMSYTLPELTGGETVELIMVTSNNSSHLEQMVAKAKVKEGGHFILDSNSLLAPTLTYHHKSDILNVSYYLKLPSDKRLTVQVTDPPQFKPLNLNISPGGTFSLRMALTYSEINFMFFAIPMIMCFIGVSKNETTLTKILALLGGIVCILLTIRPLLITYLKSKAPWAKVALNINKNEEGELKYSFLRDKVLEDLNFKITGEIGVNSNFSGSMKDGFYIIAYETQLKVKGKYKKGESITVPILIPRDLPALKIYNLRFTQGDKVVFDHNINLLRDYSA